MKTAWTAMRRKRVLLGRIRGDQTRLEAELGEVARAEEYVWWSRNASRTSA
ncbi:MAG: hypothetical protein U0610_07370 [bacterium]